MKMVLVVVAALGISYASLFTANAQGSRSELVGLLDTYFEGRHDEAVKTAASRRDLGPMRVRFITETPAWIDQDPALAGARRAAAAAFLLEVAAARLETDWGRFVDLIEWMCLALRSAGAPTPFERIWHLSSVALAGRARARTWLLGTYPRLPTQPPRSSAWRGDDRESPGHLLHARERFPDDAELHLAHIVAWMWGRDSEAPRNSPTHIIPIVARRPSLLLEAVTALEPLTGDELVGAEALVRTGLVHRSLGNHDASLNACRSAQDRAHDRISRYLAFFCAGRALESLNRADQAMSEYAKAVDVIPAAESATIALASLRFVHDDREAAVTLLTPPRRADGGSDDPGRLTGYGSFMRWPELRSSLRAELKR